MHDDDPAHADQNLTALLDTLVGSPWFTQPDENGRYPAFFFCYDEDDGTGDNRVFAALWGLGVPGGGVSLTPYTHHSFCRTVTDNWGLALIGPDPIQDVWNP